MSSSINAKKNIHLEKLLQNAASDYLISGQMKGVGDWAYAIKKVRNDFVHKSSDEFLTYYRECCDAGMYLHADITILHDSIATLCRFRLALMINGGRIIHASDYLSNCKIKRKMLNVGKNKFRRLLKGCHDMSVDLKQYDKRKWSQK